MVVGLFLKNIKNYEKTVFVPTVKNNKPFTFYIGENGVGKSSILEALDIFFNNQREWNINKKATKKDDAIIAPILLIKKDNPIFKSKKTEFEYLSKISECLLTWDIENTTYLKSNIWVVEFHKYLQDMKYNITNLNDYYLFIAPIYPNKGTDENIFFTFESIIKNDIENYNINTVKNLIEIVKTIYSYIYIPVETPVEEILKMETTEMQMLLSEDILKFTENMLLEKNIKNHDKDSRKKSNIVETINQRLDTFMYAVNHSISAIDNSYAYTVEGKFKKNLTAIDIREQIFKAYFSIRSLYKNNKNIVQLSSGEKRKALIDIATAFLTQSSKREKYIILAIDEPETSMHMKNVFDQFKYLENLVINHNIQLIGTTHWYGFLPITDYGNLSHISHGESTNIKIFDFYNLFERQINFPDDIEMKSFFELVTSIISSIKSTQKYTKWIICEGSDDKKYLEYYLKYNCNKDLRIIPVSGCGNVRKLYSLLFASLSEKDKVKVNGKILCLIDTDLGSVGLDSHITSDKDKTIYIRRLQANRDHIILEKIVPNSNAHSPTEIEDALEPNKYYEVLQKVLIDTEVWDIFKSYKQNPDAKISKVHNINHESLLIFDEDNGSPSHVNQFKQLLTFLATNEIKQKICTCYISSYNAEVIPQWIEDIVNLLELDSLNLPDQPLSITDNAENKDITLDNNTTPELITTILEESVISHHNSSSNGDDEYLLINQEALDILMLPKYEYSHLLYINNYIENNLKNADLLRYCNNNFTKFIGYSTILQTIFENKMQIYFTIDDLLINKSKFMYKIYDLSFVLQIMFQNYKNNIFDSDLEKIRNLLFVNNENINNSQMNEIYSFIYVALKLKNLEDITTVFRANGLMKLINSIETVIYFSHSNKYIKIGYDLQNLVALSNNILNSTTYAPYIDIYIHALTASKIFDKVLAQDTKGTFKKKLDKYYANKPKQDNQYNKYFNKIFNNFNIKE